jgi:hypothetical protein
MLQHMGFAMNKSKRIEKIVQIRKNMLENLLKKDEKKHWSLLRLQTKLEYKKGKYCLSRFDCDKINRKLKKWTDKTGILKKFDH